MPAVVKAFDVPLTIAAPALDAATNVALLGARRGEFVALLERHGALRFTGTAITTTHDFGALSAALFGGASFGYAGGDSPRTRLSERVYTSTEFPADYLISLHNELSYAASWPSQLLFCCATPPAAGGETPIADGGELLRALDPELIEEFERRGVTYVRNLHGGGGFGRSWQATFETDDRAVVERACAEGGGELRWKDDGGAQLRQTRRALITHPRTGELLWFNQAEQFHPSTYPKPVYDALIALNGDDPDRLPSYALFGDGGTIPLAMFDAIRRAGAAVSRTAPWQDGDVLWVDNLQVLHGRNAFRGDRRVLVAMA